LTTSLAPDTPAPELPSPAAIAPPGPVRFPVRWLLQHAAPAVRYRAADIARLPAVRDGRLAALPLAQPSAIRLAMMQSRDGFWGATMLGVPVSGGTVSGVGTVPAAFHLSECCWDAESPPLARARRVLFRLLPEDDDPAYLFEFSDEARPDVRLARRRRRLLREAAGAALARAGYESDPRLRGAAGRALARIDAFLRSPIAAHPFTRIGNRHVLAEEAAPPSIFALSMFAWMPRFRSEHYPVFERLYHYLAAVLPRQDSVQLVGDQVVAEPYLVLGDMLPHRNAADADVSRALLWLETMARLGYLRRNEGWLRVFERYLDDADRSGVWQPRRGATLPPAADALSWATRLWEGDLAGDEARGAVTMRLGVIARLMGRELELV
jgi:hypothetical protein